MYKSKRLVLRSMMLCLIVLMSAAEALAESLVDPTAPPQNSTIVSGVRSTRLDAILMQDDKHYAVINGKTLTEGQSVDDIKVLSIEPARVAIEHDHHSLWLNLFDDVNVKPVDKSNVSIDVLVSVPTVTHFPIDMVSIQPYSQPVQDSDKESQQ